MITLEEVKNDPEVNCYVEMANCHLGAMGYTDHSFRHLEIVSQNAREILKKLEYPPSLAELAAIAGYLHDIGNVISRSNHSQSGALIAFSILKRLGMPCEDIALVMGAIGNHDEEEGQIVNLITAALVLADKTDVHRSRVRNTDFARFDIHDRVNYAVVNSDLVINGSERLITLYLVIETAIVPVIEYFEIFLQRMLMCRRAASFLSARFSIIINNARLL
ncbi:MAG: HD domain-containing protein [Peptococcaceae bacterium]|nr:HD domain-containing protein [Peptococcaceae bacterium]MDH7525125.1 HD domain-containing protein [Peptococcaceae bacterium]